MRMPFSPNCYKWKMLHYYLEKYSNLVYYDAVCKRLLTFGQSIPDYIESAFKVSHFLRSGSMLIYNSINKIITFFEK